MEEQTASKVAMGTVIPLGDGSVGKTVILQLLLNKDLDEKERIEILNKASKSKNIEMEFAAEDSPHDNIDKVSIQYYNFPGQIQKESAKTVTFQEILHIFQFLPALKQAHVILLMYDTNRLYTLKSLENWVRVALEKEWISTNTLIILVSNKTDLQTPNDDFVEDIKQGIVNFINQNGLELPRNHVISRYTSCKDDIGINQVREDIVNWISTNGIKR